MNTFIEDVQSDKDGSGRGWILGDEWNNDNFSIGEISEIFKIPAKMLRYWDQIDLLKPFSKDESSGYRYYSSSQFYLLNFIRYLRKLDVPYETIKAHLHETDIASLAELIRKQIFVTQERVRELTNIQESFKTHISDIEQALQITDLETVEIKNLPARKIIQLPRMIYNRKDFELSIRRLEKLLLGGPTLLVSQVALILDRESMLNGEYEVFKAACIPRGNFRTQEENLLYLPEGEYATLRFWGHLKTSGRYYDLIKESISRSGYEICGDLIRECLAPGTQAGGHSHLAEITVPVRRFS